jgi:predicted SprT family Zn-dependent metalloprotease
MSQVQKNYLITEDSITIDKFQEVYNTLMRRTWTVNHAEYNLSDEGWSWGFHAAKTAVGTCYFNRFNSSKNRIMISRPLLEANLDTMAIEFEDTIRHEIAHAIDYSIRRTSDHGYLWQNIAVQVGAEPNQGKRLTNSAQHKWIGKCKSCGKEAKRHKLTRGARAGACNKCCREKNGGFFHADYMFNWEQQY